MASRTTTQNANLDSKISNPLIRLRGLIRLFVSLDVLLFTALFCVLWFLSWIAFDYGVFKVTGIDYALYSHWGLRAAFIGVMLAILVSYTVVRIYRLINKDLSYISLALVLLSVLAFFVSLFGLLLLTVPVYRLLAWLTGARPEPDESEAPLGSVDFVEPAEAVLPSEEVRGEATPSSFVPTTVRPFQRGRHENNPSDQFRARSGRHRLVARVKGFTVQLVAGFERRKRLLWPGSRYG